MTDRIKAIHVITRLDKGGSAENTILTLAGLDKDRYDLLLIKGASAESDMTAPESAAVERSLDELRQSGVRIATLPELVRKTDPVKDLAALFALVRIFRRERPDIVHTHTSKAGILGRWAARIAGRPLVVHTPHGHIFWGYFGRPLTALFIRLEKWTARITHRIVTLTEQEKKDHLERSIAPAEKFTTIHSGVELEPFAQVYPDRNDIKREMRIPENAFVVGTVGRLTLIKGQRFLIEAAGAVVDAYPDTRFVMLGHGELKPDLQETAARLGLQEHVLFPGWRADVPRIMSLFDVFVLPSLNEGMGKVLVEAMAAGKPVVASRIGGIVDLIEDGKNGLLVPPADPAGLVQAIVRLRSNPALRRRLGEAGRETAARYSAGTMVEKIQILYGDLLKQGS